MRSSLPFIGSTRKQRLENVWRSLGLTEGCINGTGEDNDEYYERWYKVIKTWWERDGACVKLAKASQEHKYTTTFERYCLKKHDPSTGKTEGTAYVSGYKVFFSHSGINSNTETLLLRFR